MLVNFEILGEFHLSCSPFSSSFTSTRTVADVLYVNSLDLFLLNILVLVTASFRRSLYVINQICFNPAKLVVPLMLDSLPFFFYMRKKNPSSSGKGLN